MSSNSSRVGLGRLGSFLLAAVLGLGCDGAVDGPEGERGANANEASCASIGGPAPGFCEASWRAEYYANQVYPNLWPNVPFTGTPVVREVEDLDLNWGEGNPAPGVGANHFGASFSRWVYFPRGNYILEVDADDGVQVFIDGQPQLGPAHAWHLNAPRQWYLSFVPDENPGPGQLPFGPHRIEVRYFEYSGPARVKFDWRCQSECGDRWEGRYYASSNWTAERFTRSHEVASPGQEIAFNWGHGSPQNGVHSLPGDNFSVRWNRKAYFAPGWYRFQGRADDLLQTKIDGVEVLNLVTPGQFGSSDLYLMGGQHALEVRYRELAGPALAELGWIRLPDPPPPGPWTCDFFPNRWLSGPATYTERPQQVAYNWGAGSPSPVIPADGFSMKCRATLPFAAGTHEFATVTDDGVRLRVDGALVIDRWQDQAPTRHTGQQYLTAGSHQLELEFYENLEGASASLSWKQVVVPPGVASLWTCAQPWQPSSPDNYVKVYRWTGAGSPGLDAPSGWDLVPRGNSDRFLSIDNGCETDDENPERPKFGRIKVDGLQLDLERWPAGHPFKVERYTSGQVDARELAWIKPNIKNKTTSFRCENPCGWGYYFQP